MKALLLFLALAPSAFAGDSDGGGGGSLPDQPTTMEHIFDLVTTAKRDLRLYLRYRAADYASHPGRHSVLDDKLFGAKRTILDVLEATDVEIRTKKPCFDKNGKAWDGSIYADRPNAICISAFRLAPKLMDENSRKEVEALLLHELSHLVGTTEEEAVTFQRAAAENFKKGTDAASTDWLTKYVAEMSRGVWACDDIETRQDTLTVEETFANLNEIEEVTRNYFPFAPYLGFDLLSPDQLDYHQEVQTTRLNLAGDFIRGLVDPAHYQFGLDQYNALFGDKTQMTIQEYFNKTAGDVTPPQQARFPNELIHRLTSKEDVKRFLEEFKDYLGEQAMNAILIQSNDALHTLHGPWYHPQDFWGKFRGKYVVTNADCQDSGIAHQEIRSFEVAAGEGGLELRYNSGVEDITEVLADGAYDPGAPSVRVSGDAHSATRLAESDTSWSRFWGRKEWVLAEKNGAFQMTRTLYERDQTPGVIKETKSICVYKLRAVSR